jgi:hypothetical protein
MDTCCLRYSGGGKITRQCKMATGYARMAFILVERCGTRATVRLPMPIENWTIMTMRRERDDLLLDIRIPSLTPSPSLEIPVNPPKRITWGARKHDEKVATPPLLN